MGGSAAERLDESSLWQNEICVLAHKLGDPRRSFEQKQIELVSFAAKCLIAGRRLADVQLAEGN